MIMNEDNSKTNDCTFCAELNKFYDKSNYSRLSGQYDNGRILWKNDNFALIPSLGPLVEGHLLLIPIIHSLSFADLSKNMLLKVVEIVSCITGFFREFNQDIIFFEHGALVGQASMDEARRIKARSGLCTDHAHLHILPGITVNAVLSRIEQIALHSGKREILDLSILPEVVDNNSPYILIGGSTIQLMTLYGVDEIPSQFMRQLIASIIGVKEWNWCKEPRIDLVQNVINVVGPALKNRLEITLKDIPQKEKQ